MAPIALPIDDLPVYLQDTQYPIEAEGNEKAALLEQDEVTKTDASPRCRKLALPKLVAAFSLLAVFGTFAYYAFDDSSDNVHGPWHHGPGSHRHGHPHLPFPHPKKLECIPISKGDTVNLSLPLHAPHAGLFLLPTLSAGWVHVKPDRNGPPPKTGDAFSPSGPHHSVAAVAQITYGKPSPDVWYVGQDSSTLKEKDPKIVVCSVSGIFGSVGAGAFLAEENKEQSSDKSGPEHPPHPHVPYEIASTFSTVLHLPGGIPPVPVNIGGPAFPLAPPHGPPPHGPHGPHGHPHGPPHHGDKFWKGKKKGCNRKSWKKFSLVRILHSKIVQKDASIPAQ